MVNSFYKKICHTKRLELCSNLIACLLKKEKTQKNPPQNPYSFFFLTNTYLS